MKIVTVAVVFFLSFGNIFAGGTSLKKSQESLESLKSGKDYVLYIDDFLEGISQERLQEIYERAGTAYRNKTLQSQLDRVSSSILAYVYVKAYYELNPELYAEDTYGDAPMNTKVVEQGDIISVHYTGKLEDGIVFDSSYDRGETLEFTAAAGQMIPGFDMAVIGMRVGETKTVTILPSSAYGEYDPNNNELIFKSDLRSFTDAGISLEPGTFLPTQFGELEIIAVSDDAVIIDLNHPLAGETLIFDIEIIEIK